MESSTSIVGKWPADASRRDSTTWPSRIERAQSAIGSSMSSPSTSTVYSPVMLPASAAPARSSSRGSRENTDGG